MDDDSQFWVMCTGSIESCEFASLDNLFCKFSFAAGPDWTMVDGVEEGITQISEKHGGSSQDFVWNFPLHITYKSTNAFRWPQIALSVYGLDAFGRDVVRGYGSAFLPIASGGYTKHIRLFKPESTSPIQQFSAWLLGQRPEFRDSKFVTRSEGREVTRVRSNGVVKVVLNVVVRNMADFGYSEESKVFGERTHHAIASNSHDS